MTVSTNFLTSSDPMRAGYVHELHLNGVRAQAGEPLVHPQAYYTLVNIPRARP